MQQHGNATMKQFLYLNGDSWFHRSSKITNGQNPLFENIFIINHSIPGDGNINIINRTKSALEDLKKINIKPWVCLGLSEVGRNFTSEFALVSPKVTNDIGKYLELVAAAELKLAQSVLKDYNSYICNAWVSNYNNAKSIIDFIDQDFKSVDMCYTVGNGVYNWLGDRQDIFKFTKSSFVSTIENKQKFEQLLLNNRYIDDSLHLAQATAEQPYQKFFTHAITHLKLTDNQQQA